MKLTKQKLRQIIKEEITSLDEKNYYPTDYGTDPTRRERTSQETERDRRERERQDSLHRRHRSKRGSVRGGAHLEEELETVSMGADIEGFPQPEEEEDPIAGRLGTPEEQLLSRILLRAVVDKYDSPQDLANDLGVEMTNDMSGFIRYLKANPMFGSS